MVSHGFQWWLQSFVCWFMKRLLLGDLIGKQNTNHQKSPCTNKDLFLISKPLFKSIAVIRNCCHFSFIIAYMTQKCIIISVRHWKLDKNYFLNLFTYEEPFHLKWNILQRNPYKSFLSVSSFINNKWRDKSLASLYLFWTVHPESRN